MPARHEFFRPSRARPHQPSHALPGRAITSLAASLFALCLGGLSGCAGTPPTMQYTLDAPGTQRATEQAAYAASPVIVVLPAEIPTALDRPQIVLRDGENRLVFSEYHRWAAPLREDIARVVANELGRRLRSNGVVALPAIPDDMMPDYRLTLLVRHFDAHPDRGVMLDAHWQLKAFRARDGKPLTGHGIYEEALTADAGDNSHAALAAAHARALRRLAGDIATALSR